METLPTIAELLDKHAGAQGWIFGKGPSLDQFEMSSAGPLRICINESLLIVPRVTSIAFVGMDGRGGYAQSIGTPAPPGGGQHDRIRRDSEIVCERLKIPFRFV